MSNIVDKKLFEQIFGHTTEALANKLINTTDKEENQVIINNIKKNKGKIHEEDEFYDFVMQSGQQCADLSYTIKLSYSRL